MKYVIMPDVMVCRIPQFTIRTTTTTTNTPLILQPTQPLQVQLLYNTTKHIIQDCLFLQSSASLARNPEDFP